MLVDSAVSVRDKAFIITLYESGARIGARAVRLVRNTHRLNLNNLNRHAGFRVLCQPSQASFTW